MRRQLLMSLVNIFPLWGKPLLVKSKTQDVKLRTIMKR